MGENWLPQKYKVVLSPNYRETRRKVFLYISEKWWENSVENFNVLLGKRLRNPAVFPNGYPRYQNTPYRRFLVWDYLVLFRVDVDSGRVIVFGIYHSSQNLSELLSADD